MATLVWSRAGILHPAVGLFSSVGAGIEVQVSPSVWPQLWGPFGRADHAPPEPDFVLTGALEPPLAGAGEWSFTLFRTSDLHVMAEERRSFSEADAGSVLAELVARVLKPIAAFEASFVELAGLSWAAVSAAAQAELALSKGQAAALLSLERCVSDAPMSVYPAKRLGEVVAELARTADAAQRQRLRRVVARAMETSPGRPELLLAEAALLWSENDRAGALEALRLVTALAPQMASGHHFMARVLRDSADWSAARASLERAQSLAPEDLLLAYEFALHAAHDDQESASAEAYGRASRIAGARDIEVFRSLADTSEKRRWSVLASVLVDHVLQAPALWPTEALTCSERLCLQFEPEGAARAARLEALAVAIAARPSAAPLAAPNVETVERTWWQRAIDQLRTWGAKR